MEKILSHVNAELYNKFEKAVKECLSIYLLNSATEQGLIDERMKDYILTKV